jgi:hypothetical protein
MRKCARALTREHGISDPHRLRTPSITKLLTDWYGLQHVSQKLQVQYDTFRVKMLDNTTKLYALPSKNGAEHVLQCHYSLNMFMLHIPFTHAVVCRNQKCDHKIKNYTKLTAAPKWGTVWLPLLQRGTGRACVVRCLQIPSTVRKFKTSRSAKRPLFVSCLFETLCQEHSISYTTCSS